MVYKNNKTMKKGFNKLLKGEKKCKESDLSVWVSWVNPWPKT